MAPFTKRQVGYIKAVAGIGQHKSFAHYTNSAPDGGWTTSHVDSSKNAQGEYTSGNKYVQDPAKSLTLVSGQDNFKTDGKRLAACVWCLNNLPLTVDDTDDFTDINDQKFMQSKFDKVLTTNKMLLLTQYSVAEGDEQKVHTTTRRIGEDFYVDSTHIRWRFTMPDFTVASGKQPHHEYRFIVFRQRKRTMQRYFGKSTTEGQWLNWNYDLFSGYEGRRVGWSGHRTHEVFDDSEKYVNTPVTIGVPDGVTTQSKLTTDDLMTMPLNDADYVIMRDERFFLGAEHGKSHYETVTRFDFSDPGSCGASNMIEGLEEQDKNYDWWFLILGTTNDEVTPLLNVSVRGTTAITSA